MLIKTQLLREDGSVVVELVADAYGPAPEWKVAPGQIVLDPKRGMAVTKLVGGAIGGYPIEPSQPTGGS